jgi:hypothetical protein
VSGRKRLKQQVVDDMFAGKISVPEARARIAWVRTGVYKSAQQAGEARAAVMKSAGPVTGFEQYFDSADPQIREWARAAAHRSMVTKGLVPWAAPAGSSPAPCGRDRRKVT